MSPPPTPVLERLPMAAIGAWSGRSCAITHHGRAPRAFRASFSRERGRPSSWGCVCELEVRSLPDPGPSLSRPVLRCLWGCDPPYLGRVAPCPPPPLAPAPRRLPTADQVLLKPVSPGPRGLASASISEPASGARRGGGAGNDVPPCLRLLPSAPPPPLVVALHPDLSAACSSPGAALLRW